MPVTHRPDEVWRVLVYQHLLSSNHDAGSWVASYLHVTCTQALLL